MAEGVSPGFRSLWCGSQCLPFYPPHQTTASVWTLGCCSAVSEQEGSLPKLLPRRQDGPRPQDAEVQEVTFSERRGPGLNPEDQPHVARHTAARQAPFPWQPPSPSVVASGSGAAARPWKPTKLSTRCPWARLKAVSLGVPKNSAQLVISVLTPELLLLVTVSCLLSVHQQVTMESQCQGNVSMSARSLQHVE